MENFIIIAQKVSTSIEQQGLVIIKERFLENIL